MDFLDLISFFWIPSTVRLDSSCCFKLRVYYDLLFHKFSKVVTPYNCMGTTSPITKTFKGGKNNMLAKMQ